MRTKCNKEYPYYCMNPDHKHGEMYYTGTCYCGQNGANPNETRDQARQTAKRISIMVSGNSGGAEQKIIKYSNMTNIEKVKRILDAGHWVKVTYTVTGCIQIVTSYHNNVFSYADSNPINIYTARNPSFKDCIIEVIQRIPTPYNPGDKVLVLSNPRPDIKKMDDFVGKVCEVDNVRGVEVYVSYTDDARYFPYHCLAPAFEEDSLSGKEAKIVIDGKEYTCVIK